MTSQAPVNCPFSGNMRLNYDEKAEDAKLNKKPRITCHNYLSASFRIVSGETTIIKKNSLYLITWLQIILARQQFVRI